MEEKSIINKKLTKTEYCKIWRKQNPDKLKQSRDNWYNNNKNDPIFKEKKKQYQKEYYNRKKIQKELIQ